MFEWVAFRPLQCGSNPWSEGDVRTQISSPIEELDVITEFFAGQGIPLREVGLLDPPGEIVCLACSCGRGDLLVARAAPEDAVRLVREFDFSFLFQLGQGFWLARMPVQCGGNPWEEVSPLVDPLAEARAVRR